MMHSLTNATVCFLVLLLYHGSVALNTASTSITSSNNRDELFRRIFTSDVPLLDVRAEIEFSKGAFPTSVNHPVLDDEQRHLVGICYKEKGPDAAFQLGFELVTPVKEQRINAWKQFIGKHPNGYLYCFRGGSRSQLTQKALKEAGVNYPLIDGGFKAMRTYLLQELEEIQHIPLVMISSRTCSGKTHLLSKMQLSHNVVDLEGLANHRGSTFGYVGVKAQPTQIQFDNALAIDFLKLREKNDNSPIFIEEEGNRIGDVRLPLSMHQKMLAEYPVIDLVTSMEERVDICVQDYVTDLFPQFEATYDDVDLAHKAFQNHHLESLKRIKKRLGGDNYQTVHAQTVDALNSFQISHGDLTGFRKPVKILLKYYDKMYDYQAEQRQGKVLFRGSSQEILDWVESDQGKHQLLQRQTSSIMGDSLESSLHPDDDGMATMMI